VPDILGNEKYNQKQKCKVLALWRQRQRRGKEEKGGKGRRERREG
jgi:hypothetical protein